MSSDLERSKVRRDALPRYQLKEANLHMTVREGWLVKQGGIVVSYMTGTNDVEHDEIIVDKSN